MINTTAVMVQGCTSWAGKSLITTALCRWFARQGIKIAPFKAQNMANNARVVGQGDETGEIGVAQWLQAKAAGVEPDVRMNPVLLKPGRGGSQVIRNGRVDDELTARPWQDRSEALWPTIVDAYESLRDEFDLVVIEGAGSPAEINLSDNDVVNMRVADLAGASVLLAVDIDRGGAFAHLYGTWALLPPNHRERIAGFILNRFRGDATLLPPGPEQLQRLTGIPTIGVLPMLRHGLPDEDGAARHVPVQGGRPVVAVVRYPAASNIDEFTMLEQVADVRWATAPWHLDGADLVVLPGSKHVAADLGWLRGSALDGAVRRHAHSGTTVLGICGGMQMLGTRLDDPAGVDGSGEGLGLLPITTTFHSDKSVARRRFTFPDELSGPWSAVAGRTVDGYEIRHGRSDGVDVITRHNVGGWYVHGVFEDPDVLDEWFGTRPDRSLDDTFDMLADAIDERLDLACLDHGNRARFDHQEGAASP